MKSKIFNTDQARAIQDGRMTQFMQVIRKHPANKGIWTSEECEGLYHTYTDWIDDDAGKKHKPEWLGLIEGDFQCALGQCPFGKVGDVITVKEIWIRGITIDENEKPVNDDLPRFWYKADNNAPDWYRPELSDDHPKYLTPPWKSPATMPSQAARLFLRITNIRVMRAQELKNEDAKGQGYNCRTEYIGVKEMAWKENKFYWIIDFTKTDKP